MSAPCVTCRCTLSRLDLADGLRCDACTERAFKELDALPPQPEPAKDWHVGMWPDTGSTTVALLLAALFMLGFVGLVLVGQDVVCDARDDRISYCEAGR